MEKEVASCPGKSYPQWNFCRCPRRICWYPVLEQWSDNDSGWTGNTHYPFSLHTRKKKSLHKQKQKKKQQSTMTIQCMEAGLFISQVQHPEKNFVWSWLVSTVIRLNRKKQRKYSMLWLSYSNHSKCKMHQKGSLNTQYDFFSFFFIPIFSSSTPLLLFYKSKNIGKSKS